MAGHWSIGLPTSDVWLQARGVARHYERATDVVRAVNGVDLSVSRGEVLAIVGSSGSGKSTLLNLFAGLDTPTAGSVEVGGRDLSRLSRRELAEYRAREVGMVFQSFQLISHYTAEENVALALRFGRRPRSDEGEPRRRLEELGLGDRLGHVPADLSGGEQQRVAIARALVGGPSALLADEPTGNLDAENTERIADLLVAQAKAGRAVVMTTHDLDLAAARADRIVRIDYGEIVDGPVELAR